MDPRHPGNTRFDDRAAAGRALADRLRGDFAGRDDVLVLGLPRGGVPVAAAVARELHLRLDVLVIRKLGVPGRPELAMGAISSGGGQVRNDEIIRRLHINDSDITAVAASEAAELQRREQRYRGDRDPLVLTGTVALLVDDGLATGASMRAAVAAARSLNAAKVMVAVPVGSPSGCRGLARLADAVVCPVSPERFRSVGEWYDDFEQVDDEAVRALLCVPGSQ
jgi:predicted phosphoribosyltransferase